MSHGFELQALRYRIAGQERLASNEWPSFTLGAPALDTLFPELGLATGALHEIAPFSASHFAAGIGFGACLAIRVARLRPGYVLWAFPARSETEDGVLYPPGLAAFGFDPDRLIQVEGRKPIDVLWAAEEGLACSALSIVIGVLPTGAKAYDFPASRRLAMRAARHGVTVLIIRQQQDIAAATAAQTRWSVQSLASPNPATAESVFGPPRWRLHLSKNKKGTPGRWDVEWNHETLSFRLPAPLADRTSLPMRATGTETKRDAPHGEGFAKPGKAA